MIKRLFKTPLTTVFVCLITICYGCDCGYLYDLSVTNNSKQRVMVRYALEMNETVDSILLDVNETALLSDKIDHFPGGGCPGIQCEHFQSFVLSMEVKPDTSKMYSNWKFNCDKMLIQETGNRTADMTVNLTDEDLE